MKNNYSKKQKPDKDVLINICNQENCSISDAAYIGDSLTKDVYMAKLANITSIWANYPKEKTIIMICLLT